MFRQNTSSLKTWSLTCCKKWTWRRDASKFGELILWVACSTKTLLSTKIKAFHISPPHCGIQCSIPSKVCPVQKRQPLSCHKNGSQIFDATKLWKHTIPLTYNTKTLISNISETHRFSPQMRLIAYPDHKTTLIFDIKSHHHDRQSYGVSGCTPLNTVPILSCVKAFSKNRHFRVFIMIKIGQRHVFLKDYVHIHQIGSHFVGGYRLDFSPGGTRN